MTAQPVAAPSPRAGAGAGASSYPNDVGSLVSDGSADRKEFRVSGDSKALWRLITWHWSTKVLPFAFTLCVAYGSMALFHVDTGSPYTNALGPSLGAGLITLVGRRRGPGSNEAPSPGVDIRSMTDQEVATELRVREEIREGASLSGPPGSGGRPEVAGSGPDRRGERLLAADSALVGRRWRGPVPR